VAVRGDEDVPRLDVAVDQPLVVGAVQGRPNLLEDPQRLRRFQRSALVEEGPEVRPLHVLHGDVQLAVRLSGVVHGDHVGVLDPRRRPGLPDEPLTEGLVGRKVRRQDLEGDLPAEVLVLGEIDHPHPAPPDQALDPVRAQPGADPVLGHGPF
jgi:hypothetical protein